MTRVWYDLHPLDAVNHICERITEIENWLEKHQQEWIDSNIGRQKTDYLFKKNERWTRKSLEDALKEDPWCWGLGFTKERKELKFLEKRLSEIMKYHDSDMRVNIEFKD